MKPLNWLNDKEQVSLETTRYVGRVSDLTVNSKRPCCIKFGCLRSRCRKISARRRKAVVTAESDHGFGITSCTF